MTRGVVLRGRKDVLFNFNYCIISNPDGTYMRIKEKTKGQYEVDVNKYGYVNHTYKSMEDVWNIVKHPNLVDMLAPSRLTFVWTLNYVDTFTEEENDDFQTLADDEEWPYLIQAFGTKPMDDNPNLANHFQVVLNGTNGPLVLADAKQFEFHGDEIPWLSAEFFITKPNEPMEENPDWGEPEESESEEDEYEGDEASEEDSEEESEEDSEEESEEETLEERCERETMEKLACIRTRNGLQVSDECREFCRTHMREALVRFWSLLLSPIQYNYETRPPLESLIIEPDVEILNRDSSFQLQTSERTMVLSEDQLISYLIRIVPPRRIHAWYNIPPSHILDPSEVSIQFAFTSIDIDTLGEWHQEGSRIHFEIDLL